MSITTPNEPVVEKTTKKKDDSKVYILDTNIILDSMENIEKISENGKNILIIPETVLIELESKKKDFGELGFQAREFSRMIANCVEEKKVSKKNNPNEIENFSIVKLLYKSEKITPDETLSKIKIHIISKEKYESDFNAAYVKESNDKRIIEVAEVAKKYYVGKKIIFLSLDGYARIFSKLKNIATETLRDNIKKHKELVLMKTFEINDEHVFNSLNNEFIYKIDKDHKKENFSYEFIWNDIKKYGIIINEHVSLLDEHKDFKGVAVQPKNIKQKLYMKALLSNMYDTHIIDARAGSGKTLISLVAAMKLIDDHNQNSFNKIVYVRNSIESTDKGAEVGFLSGNDEKFRIYNMALYDNLEFIARKQLAKKADKKKKELEENPVVVGSQELKNKFSGKGKIEEAEENLNVEVDKLILELKRKYNIETLWPGEARGRTLSNAIVIMDEWQNSSNNTTQLIMSRLDESCKAIIIGSNRQIDNMYLSKYNNGLTSMFNLSVKNDLLTFFGITMETSVRGKFAYFADEVF